MCFGAIHLSRIKVFSAPYTCLNPFLSLWFRVHDILWILWCVDVRGWFMEPRLKQLLLLASMILLLMHCGGLASIRSPSWRSRGQMAPRPSLQNKSLRKQRRSFRCIKRFHLFVMLVGTVFTSNSER